MSTIVSIGKFPFDYSEQQVMDIAKTVGPVKDLKLLFDDMTGKSKGYAVVVYADSETASSACRNLNYMNLPNGRFLRCMFIDEDVENRSAIKALGPLEGQNGSTAQDRTVELPNLPRGIQLHPNQTPPQIISQVVSKLNEKAAIQILKEAKQMANENPQALMALLDKYPQVAHALVELSLLQNTTNRELVELTVKKRAPVLNELTPNHAALLSEIMSLSSPELDALSEDKRRVIERVREEIKEGRYGHIESQG